jgi:uncharacterized integral membrane protein
MVIGIVIFAFKNSNAPGVAITFLLWRFEISLIYTLLGSMGVGVLIALFFWIPRAIKTSIQLKESKKQVKNLETMLFKPASLGQEGNRNKEL